MGHSYFSANLDIFGNTQVNEVLEVELAMFSICLDFTLTDYQETAWKH